MRHPAAQNHGCWSFCEQPTNATAAELYRYIIFTERRNQRDVLPHKTGLSSAHTVRQQQQLEEIRPVQQYFEAGSPVCVWFAHPLFHKHGTATCERSKIQARQQSTRQARVCLRSMSACCYDCCAWSVETCSTLTHARNCAGRWNVSRVFNGNETGMPHTFQLPAVILEIIYLLSLQLFRPIAPSP